MLMMLLLSFVGTIVGTATAVVDAAVATIFDALLLMLLLAVAVLLSWLLMWLLMLIIIFCCFCIDANAFGIAYGDVYVAADASDVAIDVVVGVAIWYVVVVAGALDAANTIDVDVVVDVRCQMFAAIFFIRYFCL